MSRNRRLPSRPHLAWAGRPGWPAGLAGLALLALLVAACGAGTAGPAGGQPGGGSHAQGQAQGQGPVRAPSRQAQAQALAVGAEDQYANVIAQVGGRYVSVQAVMSNPNADPHEFEASAQVAQEVARAQLVVQNGAGYDAFMSKIEAASPNPRRQVVVVQELLKAPSSTFNPHFWYDPRTMPAVAQAVGAALSRVLPSHAAYFEANVRRFDRSLAPWRAAIARFKHDYPGVPVAVTEPVADYLLQALGAHVLTPEPLQSAVMNGTDPSPQAISTQDNLLNGRKVKVLVYNEQVSDSLTATFVAEAKRAGIPVVGVYETMPASGYDYQSWMLATVSALERALAGQVPRGRA